MKNRHERVRFERSTRQTAPLQLLAPNSLAAHRRISSACALFACALENSVRCLVAVALRGGKIALRTLGKIALRTLAKMSDS